MSQTNNEDAAQTAPDQDFYEVQEILDKRLTSNGLMYQIRWRNFPEEKDYTWEPIHHLVEVEDLVKQFNKKFDEKKKAARKEKREENSNQKKKKSPHGLKRHSSEQSELDRSLPKESGSKQKEKRRKRINSNKKQDDSEKISQNSKASEQNSPIFQNSRNSKRFNNFEAFSTEKIVEKNISQLDQYLEVNNVKLGRVHQHFLEDGCLYFHVDIVRRENQIYARTFMKFQELKQSHRDQLVSYMQSWTINQLNNKALLETDQVKETIEYWREKM